MRTPSEAIRAELARLGLTFCPAGTKGALDPMAEAMAIMHLAEVADVAVTVAIGAEWNDDVTPTVQDQTYAGLIARTRTE